MMIICIINPLLISNVGRPIPHIDDIALDFPQLKIVCGHVGHPWTDEMIAVAWKHDNVYIDTSAYSPKYLPAALVRYMRRSDGARKVMFGTNFPQLSWRQCLAAVDSLQLPPKYRELYLYKNAQRVFGLDGVVDNATTSTKKQTVSKL
jgi:predicted TIM-barrel fold metal-dependent hydrolase